MLALALLFPLTAKPQYQTSQAPLLGSAWYPEQLPESAWERDLTLMQAAGFNVVRMGEFAWSTMEPAEGRYDLDWLDRAITAAGRHGLKVVLGTPTDAPPAWLTKKYPETLGANADGRLREHGGRRQFNYANPHYRALCADIVRHMAQRFGHNPDLLGWQIDNEYTDESFDAATRAQFQAFLRARYGTLANLNAHWSTAYWSQTYTDWSQIPMPSTGGNPGLLLEHKHFVTATWRSYQQNQVDVLRPLIDPAQFITTNIGGLAWSDNWDHYSISAPLDLITWDDYVGEGHLNPSRNAMLNDFVRGWKRENFWLMETQPGSVNWAPVNNALAPGETRALAWQAIGHGADAILYWQWRPALNGQEQYHGSIVGPGGDPRPLYKEVQQLGRDLAATRAALAGTQPPANIALLHTYDSRWAIDFQQHTRSYDQQAELLRFYEPLRRITEARGEQVDIINPLNPLAHLASSCDPNLSGCHPERSEGSPHFARSGDSSLGRAPMAVTQPGSLDQYTLLVAPSLNVIDESLAAKLLAWMKSGGHLLLGPRSGMKDAYDTLDPHRQPGPLAAALGAHVDQYYALDRSIPLQRASASESFGTADTWAETLAIDNPAVHIDLRYTDPNGWLDAQTAMVTRTVGRGAITYLGTLPDAASLDRLLSEAATQAALPAATLPLPEGVEACFRSGSASSVLILINHGASEATVKLPQAMRDLLQPAASASQTVSLLPQGVAVLTRDDQLPRSPPL